ncbi:hypothetical protein [Actinomadura gamaensis]|uniref:Uncharacterized protein n=1 Tax=Actinomadura gamaensis TaxID=1763541 RepID=A0ABV9U218_9ACTN
MSEQAGWRIVPFKGLDGMVPGDVRLGEERAVLTARFSAAFGERLGEVRAFRKAAWQLGLSDQYVDGGLILHYDDRDRLIYIELFEPAPVVHNDVPLLGRPYGDVLHDLRRAGEHVVEDTDGCDLPDAGFNLSASDADEPVTCVGVYVRSPANSVLGMSDEDEVEPITDHHLVSNEGTELVRLGQTKQELRRLLGPAMQSRPEYGGETQDWHFDHGLILGYDASDRLVSLAIGFVGVTGTARFRGVRLLDRPYAEVVADLASQNVRVEPGELIGRVPDHGFSLLLHGDQNPAMPVAAVIFT